MSVPVAQTEAANLGILSGKIMEEIPQHMSFAPFVGEVSRNPKTGEMAHPGTPIAQLTDFGKKDGMDHMLIPRMQNLTQAEFYGDVEAEDSGETQDWDYGRAYVNQRRNVVEGPGRQSNQRVKGLDLIKRIRPQISLKMAQWNDWNIAKTFYEYVSGNVSTAVGSGGLGKTVRYHPNIYTPLNGSVTWNGTIQNHANNIGAAVAGLSDISSHYLSVDNLVSLGKEVKKIPLPKWNVPGTNKPVWLMFCHTNAMSQLRRDADYKSANQLANMRSLNNPLFSYAEALIENFLIFESNFSVFGVDALESGGNYTLTYGDSNPLENGVDSYPVKSNIVFAPGAILRGVASPVYFDDVDKNIRNHKVVASGQIVGESRADFYDVDVDAGGTPTTVSNQSSVLFKTYSPDGWN